MSVVPHEHADRSDQAGQLSARDAEILAFERQWWKFAGAKEQAVRDKFGMSATRYYQTLNALIDESAALAQDPLLAKRLQRWRATVARRDERLCQAAGYRPVRRSVIIICPF